VATIYKEIAVDAPPDHVWAAIRDVGAVHSRLAQQFVVSTQLEGDSRVVTFANGVLVRERFVTIDDERRRLAYSVVEWKATHHNGSLQVFGDESGGTRLVWIADLLPDELAAVVEGLMETGAAAMKQTLERTLVAAHPGRAFG
jgi:Polyketide cyclase / dehydrase and lipid transport